MTIASTADLEGVYEPPAFGEASTNRSLHRSLLDAVFKGKPLLIHDAIPRTLRQALRQLPDLARETSVSLPSAALSDGSELGDPHRLDWSHHQAYVPCLQPSPIALSARREPVVPVDVDAAVYASLGEDSWQRR